MTKIYKKDSKGKIRFVEAIPSNDELILLSGIVGSTNIVTNIRKCKEKNIGKSNYTSAKEQAIKEAESFIKDKLTKGYFLTEQEALEEEVILPMLAKTYEDRAFKVDWLNPDIVKIVQPKLDGMRCLISDKGLFSRDGKKITTLPHLEVISKYLNGNILDGELYIHGENFQSNMSYIKKYTPGLSEKISFNCYDIVNDNPYSERKELLLSIKKELKDEYNININSVKSIQINTEEEMYSKAEEFILQGYEGAMLRYGDEGYCLNKRSDSLLKIKKFKDIQCEIIDIIPCNKRPSWGKPVLSYNNIEFEAGTKMTHGQKEDLLINKKDYIGKIAEIRYFEEYESGKPRFPVCYGIRLDY